MPNVMCFGDSNTHGTKPMQTLLDRDRFDRATRWPGVMAKELGSDWHVIEEGHPARTTVLDDPVDGVHKSGLRALPILLESHRPLDLVVLMLGTNDVKRRFNLCAIEIATGLDRLLAHLAGSDAGPDGRAPKAVVVSPVPVIQSGCLTELFEGGVKTSGELAGMYSHVAQRRGAVFFDAGRVAQVDPVDGVHFDAGGHAALGHALAKVARHAISV